MVSIQIKTPRFSPAKRSISILLVSILIAQFVMGLSGAPAHCTGRLAFSIFQKVFADKYKFFGLGETLKL